MVGDEGSIGALGDFHEGLIVCDHEKIQEAVEIIRDEEFIAWIGMGDFFDGITVGDRRYEPEALDPRLNTPVKQTISVKDKLRPIKRTCLGLHEGNHENVITKSFGNVIRSQVCKDLRVDYLGYVAHQKLVFPKGELEVFSTHGAGSINSNVIERPEAQEANQKIALRRKLMPITKADVGLMGHIHKLIVVEPPSRPTLVNVTQRFTGNNQNGEIVETEIAELPWFAATGSFVRTYHPGQTNYAERCLYRPLDIGFIEIRVDEYGTILNIKKRKL